MLPLGVACVLCRVLCVQVSARDLDPCLNRVVGLWCVDGFVRHLWLFAYNGPTFSGALDPLWGQLTSLVGMELSYNNFQGDLSEAFCNLTSLRVLVLDREPIREMQSAQRITALPDCMGMLPLTYFSASTNLIGTFPSTFSSARGLRVLGMSNNKLARLPADFSTQLAGLVQLDLSFNPLLNVSVPSLQGWSNLTSLLLNDCAFNGELPAGVFDSMPSLATVDISNNNAIVGPLPSFIGAIALREAALQNNAFTGPIPQSVARAHPISADRRARWRVSHWRSLCLFVCVLSGAGRCC